MRFGPGEARAARPGEGTSGTANETARLDAALATKMLIAFSAERSASFRTCHLRRGALTASGAGLREHLPHRTPDFERPTDRQRRTPSRVAQGRAMALAAYGAVVAGGRRISRPHFACRELAEIWVTITICRSCCQTRFGPEFARDGAAIRPVAKTRQQELRGEAYALASGCLPRSRGLSCGGWRRIGAPRARCRRLPWTADAPKIPAHQQNGGRLAAAAPRLVVKPHNRSGRNGA